MRATSVLRTPHTLLTSSVFAVVSAERFVNVGRDGHTDNWAAHNVFGVRHLSFRRMLSVITLEAQISWIMDL